MKKPDSDPVYEKTAINQCWACGSRTECESHHVVPQSYAGINSLQVPLCIECHEFLDRKRMQDVVDIFRGYEEATQDYKLRKWVALFFLHVIKFLAFTARHPEKSSLAAETALDQLIRGRYSKKKGERKS
jgi:hypothetical protein